MKKENYVKKENQNNALAEETDSKYLNVDELQKCSSILHQDGKKYTNEEIKIIYSYLHEMAEISVREYLKKKNEESNSNVKG